MKLIKISAIIILSIVVVNLLAYGYLIYINPKLYREGLIIKVKPLKYAIVFAHGYYVTHDAYNHTYWCHATDYKDMTFCTKALLDELKEEGYERVWLSQCHTGDSEYMTMRLKNQTNILVNGTKWYDWVSRNKKEGVTIPVFVGVGIARLGGYDNVGFG